MQRHNGRETRVRIADPEHHNDKRQTRSKIRGNYAAEVRVELKARETTLWKRCHRDVGNLLRHHPVATLEQVQKHLSAYDDVLIKRVFASI